jgi:hypothetical protein
MKIENLWNVQETSRCLYADRTDQARTRLAISAQAQLCEAQDLRWRCTPNAQDLTASACEGLRIQVNYYVLTSVS